ncbi:hypothetical protein OAS_00440 [Vibrio cyclitrophicus ZF65]|uniref:hypothetical protein n=1 Tax=Vibrio cyclitrophicus TaxID=47951 RepID=UPI00030AAD52|nr:hypothetical protein [Vibrio cyclitrophicus]OED77995.1 hypothetical protein OAS_00440 [Vibrio cyclitrophicus ZF65]
MSILPKSIIRFNSGSRPLEILICGGKEPSDAPLTNRFIGDWLLPVWQRDLVSTVEQNTAFIESAFMG